MLGLPYGVGCRPEVKRLPSTERFSVDGTLIEAWASIKSFHRKDGGGQDNDGPARDAERSFHKEKRSNDTHQSTTDPEARLYKKGDVQPAKLCYIVHSLMENRNGLAVLGGVSLATGTAERDQALELIDCHRGASTRRITLGADKSYDVTDFVGELRSRSVTPHIALGHTVRQCCRKRIEGVFGWIKESAGLAKVKLRGSARVDAAFKLVLAAYNLIRSPKLLGVAA